MSSKKGLGLAQVIERQLIRQNSTQGEGRQEGEGLPLESVLRQYELLRQRNLNLPASSAVPPAPTWEPAPATAAPANAREFISRMLPEASSAAQETGVPASFLIAQAALETGWGRSEPRSGDGRPSYNLFGIKAGRNWTGDSVEASTTEYVQGIPQRRTERFRAYGSYAEAFSDYAQLLTTNPRYAQVVGSQDASRFARGLQAAGYATDPAYASKLERVIGTVASSTS
jgi:flagellar protein FlgJ